jgi:glyoxylate/hydroxypyruvate reductase A
MPAASMVQGRRVRKILFFSELSDRSWPTWLQRAMPEFHVVTSLDGTAKEDIVAALVWKPPPGMLQGMPNLRLIQVLGAGVDHFLADPTLPHHVPVARLVDPGLTARMTEYVVLHCLGLHRRVPEMLQNQRERKWNYIHPMPTERTRVGILGLGALGSRCADALSQLGFPVSGWSRSRKESLDIASHIGATGLEKVRRQSDILILLLPLTAETENLVDRNFLAGLPDGAALINVGRGKLVVDDDLIQALDSGKLRHAVLDVFRTEPLPPEHPFWTHPKITVTPHNSSATNPETAIEQVVGNVQRALKGEAPANLVNRATGY